MTKKIYPLVCDPGIQRDGTTAASKKWTDGLWMRFQRNFPQAISGWFRIQPIDGYMEGVYPSSYTIGQEDDNSYFTWNPYIQYQPRGIKIISNNDNFLIITGCVEESVMVSPTSNGNGTCSWFNMQMPLTYYGNTSDIADASGSVTVTIMDQTGKILPMVNGFTTASGTPLQNQLKSQNLSGIGPYLGLFPSYTQWVFETGFSNFMTSTDIKSSGNLFSTTTGIKGCNVLFGIPLYNLNSINNIFYSDIFTLYFNGTTLENNIQVFPIVYVTPLNGKTPLLSSPNINTMFQLSHSGNDTGAGLGKSTYVSDYTNYGPAVVLPSQSASGSTGTGSQYFPAAISSTTNYIWSTDSVFCSGGVLNLSPFIFFYNYHPFMDI